MRELYPRIGLLLIGLIGGYLEWMGRSSVALLFLLCSIVLLGGAVLLYSSARRL